MDDFQPPPANAQALPAADVMAPSPTGNVEYEAFPVRKPEEDLNDFKVQVRASTLARCRTRLGQATSASFPWHEGALGVSTMAAGAFLGALPADIKPGTIQAVLFSTVLPVIAVAAFVAYLFLRRAALTEPARAAADVLAELPDPNKTR
jgi:hypothetical protein